MEPSGLYQITAAEKSTAAHGQKLHNYSTCIYNPRGVVDPWEVACWQAQQRRTRGYKITTFVCVLLCHPADVSYCHETALPTTTSLACPARYVRDLERLKACLNTVILTGPQEALVKTLFSRRRVLSLQTLTYATMPSPLQRAFLSHVLIFSTFVFQQTSD
jgi:hypothetical protein